MTARTRTALLAVLASLGLVAVAYGAGSMVGGGSTAASGGTSNGGAAQSRPARMFDAADQQQPAQRPRHPCPHHQDGGAGGTSNGDTSAPTDATAY